MVVSPSPPTAAFCVMGDIDLGSKILYCKYFRHKNYFNFRPNAKLGFRFAQNSNSKQFHQTVFVLNSFAKMFSWQTLAILRVEVVPACFLPETA